jgi:uncharacterized protein (TIGR02996 family)
MNPTLHALLDDIREHPDDTSLRLILADWLDDDGQDDRAEFVRCLCRASEFLEDDPDQQLWLQRATLLLSRHHREWLGEFSLANVRWDRGLIALSVGGLQPIPQEFLRWVSQPEFAWVGEVRWCLTPWVDPVSSDDYNFQTLEDLQTQQERIAALLHFQDQPQTKYITQLILEPSNLQNEDLAVALQGIDLPRLRHLSILSDQLSEGAVEILRQFPWFAQLTSLTLGYDGNLGGESSLPVEPAHCLFDLDPREILEQRFGKEAILWLQQTHGLGLDDALYLNSREIDDEALSLLAECELLSEIQHLHLNHNPLGTEGLAALLASPQLVNLQELNLSHTAIDDDAIVLLRDSKRLQRSLTTLELDQAAFGLDGLRVIRDSWLDDVAVFQSTTQLIEGVSQAYRRREAAVSIGHLGCVVPQESLRALQQMESLRSLEFYAPGAVLSLEQVRLLCAAANLRELDLEHTGMEIHSAFELGLLCGQRGILVSQTRNWTAALRLGEFLGNPKKHSCPLIDTPAILALLVDRPECEHIGSLAVQLGSQSQARLDILARLGSLAALRRLRVQGAMSREQLRRLLAMPWFDQLTHVDFQGVWLGMSVLELVERSNWQPEQLIFTSGAMGEHAKAMLRKRFGQEHLRFE